MLTLAATAAPAAPPPVVLELYTSEACSDCPPAERFLAQLKATAPGLLPLSFHVTYWDGPAWTDRYALAAATARQQWYAGLMHTDTVFTPEAVVGGKAGLNGADRAAVTDAIATARAAPPDVAVGVQGGGTLTVTAGAGPKAAARLWLFGYDDSHTTAIGGGENGGATVTEANVVRSITPLGAWSGGAVTLHVRRPAGQHMAVILQGADGRILGDAAG